MWGRCIVCEGANQKMPVNVWGETRVTNCIPSSLGYVLTKSLSLRQKICSHETQWYSSYYLQKACSELPQQNLCCHNSRRWNPFSSQSSQNICFSLGFLGYFLLNQQCILVPCLLYEFCLSSWVSCFYELFLLCIMRNDKELVLVKKHWTKWFCLKLLNFKRWYFSLPHPLYIFKWT